MPIAIAIALTTSQSWWRIWKTDFASSAPSYLIGAGAAAVVIAMNETSGYWLTLLSTLPVLYLTWRMYRAGAESEARQGAILEAANDAIVTMDRQLNIREFNPAAERLFGVSPRGIEGSLGHFGLRAQLVRVGRKGAGERVGALADAPEDAVRLGPRLVGPVAVERELSEQDVHQQRA